VGAFIIPSRSDSKSWAGNLEQESNSHDDTGYTYVWAQALADPSKFPDDPKEPVAVSTRPRHDISGTEATNPSLLESRIPGNIAWT